MFQKISLTSIPLVKNFLKSSDAKILLINARFIKNQLPKVARWLLPLGTFGQDRQQSVYSSDLYFFHCYQVLGLLILLLRMILRQDLGFQRINQ